MHTVYIYIYSAYIDKISSWVGPLESTNMLKTNLSIPNIKKTNKTKNKTKLPVSHLHDCKTCSFDFVLAVRL